MKYLLCFVAMFVCRISIAQNLVPNPSFEEYLQCPEDLSELEYSTGWQGCGPTPDYYNVCSEPFWVGVPNNFLGYQQPATGQSYVGVICAPFNIREYIGTSLDIPLVTGQKYFASFKVNLPDSVMETSNRIGMAFSTSVPNVTDSTSVLPNNQAKVYTMTIVADYMNWITVSGSFIADSSYKYVMVGNFFDDSLTTYGGSDFSGAHYSGYYYVDDVCVTTDSLYNEHWTSTNHQPVQSKLSVYPTIGHQAINITFPRGSTRFNIFNAIGQLVYNSNVTSLHQAVDVSGFSDGIYFVRVQTHQGIQTAKFVVQR